MQSLVIFFPGIGHNFRLFTKMHLFMYCNARECRGVASFRRRRLSTLPGTIGTSFIMQSLPINIGRILHLPLSFFPSSKMNNTSNMRAILIKNGKGPLENLYIGETAVPTLQPGEVLVKVRTYRETARRPGILIVTHSMVDQSVRSQSHGYHPARG